MKNDRDECIVIMRGFAIFSVICAHVASIPSDAHTNVALICKFFSYIGIMGVPIFFFLSGMLYNKKKCIKDFWYSKIRMIVVPWFFCETIIWLYVVLRKGGVSVSNWIKFILGYNHSTYYLSILIILFVLFWKIRFYKFGIFLSLLISVVALEAYVWNILELSFLWKWQINPYLNPLFWMLYFALGLLVSKFNIWSKIKTWSQKIVYLCGGLIVGVFFIQIYFECEFSYWSKFSIFSALLGIVFAIGLEKVVNAFKINIFFSKMGELSFQIFLLHELFAGAVAKITSYEGLQWLVIARPLLVLFFSMFLICFVLHIFRKKNKMYDITKLLLGVREYSIRGTR